MLNALVNEKLIGIQNNKHPALYDHRATHLTSNTSLVPSLGRSPSHEYRMNPCFFSWPLVRHDWPALGVDDSSRVRCSSWL